MRPGTEFELYFVLFCGKGGGFGDPSEGEDVFSAVVRAGVFQCSADLFRFGPDKGRKRVMNGLMSVGGEGGHLARGYGPYMLL